MKKYKLIKTYPGSPRLNTIATGKNGSITYTYHGGEEETYSSSQGNVFTNLIENYPEFWQEVIEKEYEILSINTNSYFGITKSSLDIAAFEEGRFSNRNYTIHSVKRRSDGEVFTVGDRVNFNIHNSSNPTDILENISLIGERLNFESKSRAWGNSINNIGRLKKPLFTTEDGVDIYEGYIISHVDIYNGYKLEVGMKAIYKPTHPENWAKYFSTKEKAEEYILMNKPCLSLKDVGSIYVSAINPVTDTTSAYSQNRRIQDLVKSKIN